MTEVAEVVRQLATGRTDWQQVQICLLHLKLISSETSNSRLKVTQKFPKFEAQETKS